MNIKKFLVGVSAGAVMLGTLAIPALAAKGQPPIKVGPVAITGAEDIGTCNNVWAVDSYDKFYTLTLNNDGTYNLQVNYKNGIFVSQAGSSPGACESGSDNGNTIAAGVTGKLHAEWNRTVTAATAPNQSPGCGVNNETCPSASCFLNTVFGADNWTGGDWSAVGYYNGNNNGTWFDTLTNWPLNDRGDITGS